MTASNGSDDETGRTPESRRHSPRADPDPTAHPVPPTTRRRGTLAAPYSPDEGQVASYPRRRRQSTSADESPRTTFWPRITHVGDRQNWSAPGAGFRSHADRSLPRRGYHRPSHFLTRTDSTLPCSFTNGPVTNGESGSFESRLLRSRHVPATPSFYPASTHTGSTHNGPEGSSPCHRAVDQCC